MMVDVSTAAVVVCGRGWIDRLLVDGDGAVIGCLILDFGGRRSSFCMQCVQPLHALGGQRQAP